MSPMCKTPFASAALSAKRQGLELRPQAALLVIRTVRIALKHLPLARARG